HTRWPRDWSSDVCSSDLMNENNKIELRGRVYQRQKRSLDHAPLHRDNGGRADGSAAFLRRGSAAGTSATPSTPRLRTHSLWRLRSEERRVGKECRCRRWQ